MTVHHVTSADGSTITYRVTGDGPALILIGGAFNDRSTTIALGDALAGQVTAISYDRRGRGDSTDDNTSDGDRVRREVEDIAALVERFGGSASLFGHSSGGDLAIEATLRGVAVDKLAVFETPYVVEGTRPLPLADYAERLAALLAEDRRDDAVTLFMTANAGVPEDQVAEMRTSDTWGWLTSLASSLRYDAALFAPGNAVPTDRLATITTPTLALDGGNGWPWIRTATAAVAKAIPNATYRTIPNQDHAILNDPGELAKVLADFMQ